MFIDSGHYACVLAVLDAQDRITLAEECYEREDHDGYDDYLWWARRSALRSLDYLESSEVDRSPMHGGPPGLGRTELIVAIRDMLRDIGHPVRPPLRIQGKVKF